MTGRKILLIGGGKTKKSTINLELEKAGYISMWAKDTPEAIRLLKVEYPCLAIIVSDLPLSGTRNTLLRLRKFTQVPILMIGDRKDAVLMLESGADAFLETPISKIELMARVNSILRRQRYSRPEVKKIQRMVTFR
jgi:DNA-binding response OmpR family regulator